MTTKYYSDEFKLDTVEYIRSHPYIKLIKCGEYLGVHPSTLSQWYYVHYKERPASSRRSLDAADSMLRPEKQLAILRTHLNAVLDAVAIRNRHSAVKAGIHINEAAMQAQGNTEPREIVRADRLIMDPNAAPVTDNSPDVTVPASDTEPYEEKEPKEAVSAPPGNGRSIFRFFKRQPQ